GPELVAWTDGKNLRELGIYRQTGCYIERIRRNGILANPDGDAHIKQIAIKHFLTITEAGIEPGVRVRIADQRNLIAHLQHRI
ncbi:hypothetical protein MJM43_33735, partial [Salmonella enterica subsp. enterica serovar Montevideo]|nr:hypothetical protein [Salmonella enterica subsp. enterica serovar Montevideo]